MIDAVWDCRWFSISCCEQQSLARCSRLIYVVLQTTTG